MPCDELLKEIKDTKRSDHYLSNARLSVLQEEVNGRIEDVKKITDNIPFQLFDDNITVSSEIHRFAINDKIEGAILFGMNMLSTHHHPPDNSTHCNKKLICSVYRLQSASLFKHYDKKNLEEKFPKYGAIVLEIMMDKITQAINEKDPEKGNEIESVLKKFFTDEEKSQGASR
ncbi:MAG: hypothetical protein ACI9CD_000509 [Candidatus Deianiraeaceae bacterium]|jgi:hypothetical protein